MNRIHDRAFERERQRLLGIAYRMLGSVVDAEDVVQDAWLAWRRHAGTDINNPGAYLVRVTTRLSIDLLRRRKRERRHYPGPWLPEPLAGTYDEPSALGADEMAAFAESLSMGFMLMLERMSPKERATYVLREAFGMDYAAIGACLDARPETCRQWFRRGRARLADAEDALGTEKTRPDLLEAFVAALGRGDADGVIALLDDGVVLTSDGGGKALAATRPLFGVRAVSRFLLGIAARAAPSTSIDFIHFNGAPGATIYMDGRLELALSLSVREGRVTGVYILRNPDKLEGLARSSAPQATEQPQAPPEAGGHQPRTDDADNRR